MPNLNFVHVQVWSSKVTVAIPAVMVDGLQVNNLIRWQDNEWITDYPVSTFLKVPHSFVVR